jgi:hypothetical protein
VKRLFVLLASLAAGSIALGAGPVSLGAQSPSAAFGYWTTTGGKDGQGAAHGLRLHAALETKFADRTVDVEGAFSQAIFSREFPTGTDRANENSLELLSLVRLRGETSAWWPYAGPMMSVGVGCGTHGTSDTNGRISCSEEGRSEGSVRLGVAAGLTFTKPEGTFSWSADVRAQANTIASARGSGPVLLLAFGLRVR